MPNSATRTTIMIVTDWHTPAGSVEVFVEGLIGKLAETHTVVVAIQLEGAHHELPLLSGEGLTLQRFNSYRQLRRIIKRAQPSIIHIQQWTPLARRLASDPKFITTPLLLTLHEIPHESELEAAPAADPKLWQDLRTTSRLIPIVAPSPYMNQLATEHAVTMYGRTITSGVDTARYHPGNQLAARAELELPTDKQIILFVGHYGSEKNLIRLLYAMQRLPKDLPAVLVTVGFPAIISKIGSQYLAAAMADLESRGQLIDLGSIDHDDGRHPLLYQAADVFVMPSLFEPRGLATLEAMASGLPIIASKQGALEQLVNEGHNGHLIDPTDVHQLALTITTLLRSQAQRQAFGEASRHDSLEYDVKITTNSYKKLYSELTLQAD